MKAKVLIIALLLISSVSFAQRKMDPAMMEQIKTKKIAFITEKVGLTSQEAEKFWPVYNNYSARKSKLQIDRVSMIRYATQNEANMSEAELSSTADKLAQTFADEANLITTFSNDLKKALPPAKIIRLYHIENQYKQQLLRELNQRRQEQNKK